MIFLPLWGGVLGLIFGSFIANLVTRWPLGESIMTGRSRCDGCGQTLGVRDLLPVISYFIRRGRCRMCGVPISLRYPIIEAAAGLVGASALFVSPDYTGLSGAVFGWFLLALMILDVEHFWLPDLLTLPLLVLGLGAGAMGLGVSFQDRLFGAIGGFAVLFIIAQAYYYLRGRQGMGGGDPKLLAAIGAWMGWQLLPFVVLFAAILGLLSIYTRRRRGDDISATTTLPLGALLAISAWCLWLGGIAPL